MMNVGILGFRASGVGFRGGGGGVRGWIIVGVSGLEGLRA